MIYYYNYSANYLFKKEFIVLNKKNNKHYPYLFLAVIILLSCSPSIELKPPKIIDMNSNNDKNLIQIIIAGDTMLGDAGEKIIHKNGFEYPLKALKGIMKEADLTIINAEAPITYTNNKINIPKKYIYKSHPKALIALKDSGIDLCTLANNHILDYQTEGLYDFIKRLDESKINYIGAGKTESEARQGIVYIFNNVRIGFLNYMQNYGKYDKEMNFFAHAGKRGIAMLTANNLKNDIAKIKKYCDITIVINHWGNNYKKINNKQKKYGHMAIDYGADIVIGHHPHIYQEAEIYNKKPIIYSIGNFVFNTPGRSSMKYGVIAKMNIMKSKCEYIDFIPIITQNRIVNFQPRLATGEEKKFFNRQFIERSNKLGAEIEVVHNIARLKL